MRSLSTLAIALCLAACAPERADSDGEAARELAAAGDWQSWVDAEVARLERERPDFAAQVLAMEPTVTRADTLRMTDPAVRDADAAPLLLHRLQREDDPARRAALAEALPRTGGRYADALGDLLAAEGSELVREVLVASAWRAPAAEALPVIEAALGDASPQVRTAAAHTASRHPEGARVADALAARLADDAAPVRAAAARALGVHQVDRAAALQPLLADADADVRLAALRALDRTGAISSDSSHVARLAGDPDPRVRRLATRLSAARR